MTNERDERHELTADEARFVERLRAHYAPAEPSDARRTAFDARLRERLEARRRRAWVPGLVAACAVALLAWVATDLGPSDPAPGGTDRIAVRAPSANAWAERLFYADLSSRAVEEEAVELPPDYEAIEVVLLDG